MKSLVPYVSVEHGNTEKVAKAVAGVFGADLKDAKDFNPLNTQSYELIGLGSGIFNGKFHARLQQQIR